MSKRKKRVRQQTETKEPTKRDKIAAVMEAVETWYEAYIQPENVIDQDEYDVTCEVLAKKVQILQHHTTKKQSSSEPHPGGDYYTVKIEGREIQRVRCKLCGAELKPSGFSRHYEGEVCKKKREDILKLESASSGDNGVDEDSTTVVSTTNVGSEPVDILGE